MSKSPFVLPALVLFALGSAIGAQAQTAPAVRSDVYHVIFSEGDPGIGRGPRESARHA